MFHEIYIADKVVFDSEVKLESESHDLKNL